MQNSFFLIYMNLHQTFVIRHFTDISRDFGCHAVEIIVRMGALFFHSIYVGMAAYSTAHLLLRIGALLPH